VGKLVCRNITK